MLFNSIEFAIFLPVVFALYWALSKNVKAQNIFLLAASYFFYAWWDWRYLSLILFCSLVNYTAGLLMEKPGSERRRKSILTICCLVSFGVLGIFKYYDFFVNTFVDAFASIGLHLKAKTLHLVLPVGISFYTFHTLSYSIDVYRRKFEPAKDIISFFLFVSIFPLAMAGPVERANNLLPQIYRRRVFNYPLAVDGMRQILWGLFKKVVIADNCAVIANEVFDNYHLYPGSTLFLGALFFTFQIYGDFSGYSDMAIGIGKLLGFSFLRNFNYPYFSRDIAEFWRRWHISLNTWFRDYLYIPLGGSRGGRWQIARNTFAIFLISGFWHGANWTFIAWGAFHACLFLPIILAGKNRQYTNTVAEGKLFPSVKEAFQMLLTFALVFTGWILFRAKSIHDAWAYLRKLFSPSLFTPPFITGGNVGFSQSLVAILLIFIFMFAEWLGRNNVYAIEKLGPAEGKPLRYVLYYVLLFMIFWFAGKSQEFIYFQF